MKDTQKNKATWLGNGRDLLKEMSAAKEEYPPQIRALIEQYSSEVIIGKETTLTNVKLSNKRENELAIVEAKLPSSLYNLSLDELCGENAIYAACEKTPPGFMFGDWDRHYNDYDNNIISLKSSQFANLAYVCHS